MSYQPILVDDVSLFGHVSCVHFLFNLVRNKNSIAKEDQEVCYDNVVIGFYSV